MQPKTKNRKERELNNADAFDFSGMIRTYEVMGGQSAWTKGIEYIKNLIDKRRHKTSSIKAQ